MEKYKIIEGNKLITELLNNDLSKVCKNDLWDIISLKIGFTTVEDYKDEFWTEDVKFHKSWNWLMPVVEKIELLGASTDIHYFAGTKKNSTGWFGTSILGYSVGLSNYDHTNQYKSKIESVYNAVIHFIKWYNEKNN